MEIEYTDGSTEIILSDNSWQASTGPMIEADFLMGETYDSRKENTGWNTPDFDCCQWDKVNVTKKISAKLEAAPHQSIQKFHEHQPAKITEPKKGCFVFDLGTNFAGFARLKIKAKCGQKIILRFAERLNPDGTVYTKNLMTARSIDTYICHSSKQEIWEPRFTYHGFQYVEITGLLEKPKKNTITGIEITSSTPVSGSFRCSDQMANKLYRNICQAQRSNFMEVPTDCPQRDERLGWSGDAQMFIRTATYNSDVAAFFTKWLVDLEDAQMPNGSFSNVAPRKHAVEGGMAAWSEAGVICPWTVYKIYGDKNILARHYNSMIRLFEYFDKNSIDFIPPAMTHGFDWLNIKADTPKGVIATAYYAYAAKLMAKIAKVLDKKTDAKKYKMLYDNIKKAFNKEYVSEYGRIMGDTQTAYVLALTFDLLDKEKQAIALDHLIHNIKERGWCLSTGFVGTKDLMTVLRRYGRPDVSYRIFHNNKFPSWNYCIENGATSIWERWNGWTPEDGFADYHMNSFAHYAYGAVGEWMFSTIGGIDTDNVAYKNIIIRPQPGGKVRSANVTHNSIRGRITTSWKISKGNFSLKVSIPANTTATVYIPGKNRDHVYESEKQAHKSIGIKYLHQEEDSIVYQISSGNYNFHSHNAF